MSIDDRGVEHRNCPFCRGAFTQQQCDSLLHDVDVSKGPWGTARTSR